MVDKFRGKYLFQKRGVYYFSKQIPKDVRQHYSQNRIVQSLKTKSIKDAFYQSQNLLHKLHQHWFYLRVKDENIFLFPYQFTQQILQKRPQNPKLSDALQTYFKLKGKGKGEIFFRATRRAVRDVIRNIQKECTNTNDPNRWIIALISDTGMRLSEALGLKVSDIKLNEEIPYLNITPNSARKLKTKSSKRQIQHVGSSLWAAKQILLNVKGEFAFPHYTSKDHCYTNSASAALNKWLKTKISKNFVIHSFRHSMKDRLRAINCPSEMIDRTGGWSTQFVGEKYGSGFSLKILLDELSKI